MSTYYFRPVLPGICATCNEPYPALAGYMHLTAEGIVHPACDPQGEPLTYPAPKPKQNRGHRTLGLIDRPNNGDNQ